MKFERYDFNNKNCFNYVAEKLNDPFFNQCKINLNNFKNLQKELKENWIETNEKKEGNLVLFYKKGKKSPFHIGLIKDEFYIEHKEDSKMGIKIEPILNFDNYILKILKRNKAV